MNTGPYQDIPPYSGISFNKVFRFEVGGGEFRRFRIVAYRAVNGYPGALAALAVIDEDYGAVLADGLYASENVDERNARADSLGTLPLLSFLHIINQSSVSRTAR